MGYIITFLIWAVASIAAMTGWVMNIFSIFAMWSEPVTAELIIRIVGVPVGILGAVAGYF